VRYLLDTHALIWFANNDSQLSTTALSLIKGEKNTCFINVATLWEITIKSSLGKLDLKIGIEEFSKRVLKNGIGITPISVNHLKIYEILPLHHKDPFDRIIIAQSIADNITVITKDKIFKAYTSNIIW
jgi:PIN domain nuclease of toxin-antitoxin system